MNRSAATPVTSIGGVRAWQRKVSQIEKPEDLFKDR
jgi:hypothetical protein